MRIKTTILIGIAVLFFVLSCGRKTETPPPQTQNNKTVNVPVQNKPAEQKVASKDSSVETAKPAKAAKATTDQKSSNTADLNLNDPLSKLVFHTLKGKDITLGKLRGKVVIVDFWATWCGPCKMEIPGFVKLRKKYKDSELEIIGVSLDRQGPAVVKPFADRIGMNYPVAMGSREHLAVFGSVQAIPTTFIIDTNGKINQRVVGYHNQAFFDALIQQLLSQKGKAI